MRLYFPIFIALLLASPIRADSDPNEDSIIAVGNITANNSTNGTILPLFVTNFDYIVVSWIVHFSRTTSGTRSTM